jgi:hypothetical protein
MFASIKQVDVAGPFMAVGMVLAVLTLVISGVESIVMFLLRWDKFGRCLWAAFLMNVASTIVGSVLVAYVGWARATIWLPVSFALSVLIEGGVLMLMKRGATRQNWTVSLAVNLVSYLFIILPCVIWPEIIESIASAFL